MSPKEGEGREGGHRGPLSRSPLSFPPSLVSGNVMPATITWDKARREWEKVEKDSNLPLLILSKLVTKYRKTSPNQKCHILIGKFNYFLLENLLKLPRTESAERTAR